MNEIPDYTEHRRNRIDSSNESVDDLYKRIKQAKPINIMATHYGPYPTLSEQDIQDAFERGDCIIHESGDVDILIPLYGCYESPNINHTYFFYGPSIDTMGKKLTFTSMEWIVYEAPEFNNQSLPE